MKTSSKRILSILFSAVFLMATLVVYGNLIQPEIQAASSKQSLVASKQNLYDSQKAVVSQVTKLIGQFQNAAQLQQTVSLAMPIGEGVTQALNQWQGIAGANQVTLQSLNIKPPTLAIGKRDPFLKRLGSFEEDATVTGTYSAIKTFLSSLETNTRITNITSFDMKPFITSSAGNALSGGDLYSLQISAVAFYQEQ